MTNNSSEGILIHNEDHIDYIDKQLCDLLQLDISNLKNINFFDLVKEEYRDELKKQFEAVKRNKKTLNSVIQFKHLDSYFIIISSLENNKIKSRIIDLTLDKSKISNLLLYQTLDEAPVGVSIADVTKEDEPLIYVNDTFVNLTGYNREEIIGSNCRFLQGEDTDSEKVSQMREAINNGEQITIRLLNYTKSGMKFWNQIKLCPITNEDGVLTHYLGFQKNITELKDHEKSKNIFKQFAESSEQTMFITDNKWNINYVNSSFEENTEYLENEILGKKPFEFLTKNTEIYDLIKNKSNEKYIFKHEIKNRKKSGRLYNIKQIVKPVFDYNNNVVSYTIIQEDITQEQINHQIIDVLNRILRHNLRTSINVIEGYTDLLENTENYSTQKKSIKTIRNRINSMKKTSEKMKKVRNIVNKYEESSTLPVSDIEEIVNSYRKNNIIFRYDIESGEDAVIKNGTVFKIAFEEAINNAIQHNNKLTTELHLNIKKKNKILEVKLSDNNKYIPKSEWNIIKEGTETQLEHTDGIGLWILYWSITAIGGSINLIQNKPEGNTFIMQIPTV